MRSQLAQAWTAEARAKARIPRLAGGYKKMRRLLIERLEEFGRHGRLLVLSGKTGAGKTLLLNADLRMPALDLEFIAKHRGSAFGAKAEPQPTQIDFENELALNLVRLGCTKTVLVEDESRLIGRAVLPEGFFDRLRASPVVVLDEPMDVRVENTLREYVIARAEDPKLYSSLQDDLYKIRERLGGLRYAEVAADIRHAQLAYREHRDHGPSRVWIEKLLSWYYDPLYERSWRKRGPREIARGTRDEILKYLNSGGLEQIASVGDGRN
jgi:tRNA 2-selenouridine synthase